MVRSDTSAHPCNAASFEEPADSERAGCDAGLAENRASARKVPKCPRAMLCDIHVSLDGEPSKPLDQAARCNLEGYGGVDYETFGEQIKSTLAQMPDGRCPYPPGDVPGPGRGFDRNDHWVGVGAPTEHVSVSPLPRET